METVEATIDQLEQLLVDDEAHIARLRARQMVALQALDESAYLTPIARCRPAFAA